MSTGLPKRIDPQRLAAQESPLEGELGTAAMPRLQRELAGNPAVLVSVRLHARRDQAKRLLIEGQVGAELNCTCQRCMEPVALQIDGEFALAVVRDEEAARNLPAELDPLMLDPDGEIDLAALVEDELLLALPVIAMHANPEECGEHAALVKEQNKEPKEFDGASERENPFAVLKKLKQDNPD